jgi:hypothetical protein
MPMFNFGQQQAQVPQQAQPQGGGFLQQLLAPENAMPIAAALMGQQGNGQNFANAFSAYGQTAAQTAGKNRTLDFFRKNAPEYAEMVQAGMPVNEAWQTYTQQRYAKEPKGQGFINAGGGNLFNTDTGEWVSAPGGGVDSVAGLTPVWLRDKKTGKPVLGQMRKDGTVVLSGMPDSAEAIGPYDVNFDKAAGTEAGKGTGAAQVALPGATQMATELDRQIQELKSDPYLPNMLGPVDSRLPNVSSDAARVQGKINQLQGGAFLQARQMLKGGGAITDYEGKKAEEAFARLSQAQTVEDFNQALDDFNYFVQQGLRKLEAQAGRQGMDQGGFPHQSAPAPQGGNRTQSGVTWTVEP